MTRVWMFLLVCGLGSCGLATPNGAVHEGDAAADGKKTDAINLLEIPDTGITIVNPDAADPTLTINCGTLTKSVSRVPVDLLLVLDRSGSMTWDLGQDASCEDVTSCHPRWPAMREALRTVLIQSPDSIQWGLKLFSTPDAPATADVPRGCVVDPGVEAPVGTPAGAILTTLTRAQPNYNTPTRAALGRALEYLQTVTNGHTHYILLATDGQPNCAAGAEYPTTPDLPATLDAVAAAYAAGIKVYVIGVGPSAGNLDEMAQKGGTGKFYPALSPQDLKDALTAIAGEVATCEFALAEEPPNPARVGVYLDKKLVERDSPNGWSLVGTTRVVFSGTACAQIKSGAYQNIDVVFGCAEDPLVIP